MSVFRPKADGRDAAINRIDSGSGLVEFLLESSYLSLKLAQIALNVLINYGLYVLSEQSFIGCIPGCESVWHAEQNAG